MRAVYPFAAASAGNFPTIRVRHPRSSLPAAVVASVAVCACATPRRVPPLALVAPFAADSQTVVDVAPGIVRRTLHLGRGPWVAHVLDVDPARCWTLRAVKAGGAAVGRDSTLALARALDAAGAHVAGAVNADFFSFAAPGVPVGLHVQDGALITGPAFDATSRPSLLVESDGRAHVTVVTARGTLAAGGQSIAVTFWNRGRTGQGDSPPNAASAARGLTLFDARYGRTIDTVPGRLLLRLAAPPPGARRTAVVAIDSTATATLASGQLVASLGPEAPAAQRSALASLRAGIDSVTLDLALDVPLPREAVSGGPRLVRGGEVAPEIDTFGDASMRARNPRTAIGLTAAGHALLVVVDGRQRGWSEGMTMRELAELLQALGAANALNLDGGGSSTLVVRDASGALRVANRPSEGGTERAVGNALAVVRGCAAAARP